MLVAHHVGAIDWLTTSDQTVWFVESKWTFDALEKSRGVDSRYTNAGAFGAGMKRTGKARRLSKLEEFVVLYAVEVIELGAFRLTALPEFTAVELPTDETVARGYQTLVTQETGSGSLHYPQAIQVE